MLPSSSILMELSPQFLTILTILIYIEYMNYIIELSWNFHSYNVGIHLVHCIVRGTPLYVITIPAQPSKHGTQQSH